MTLTTGPLPGGPLPAGGTPAAPGAPSPDRADEALPLLDTQSGLLVAHRAFANRTIYNIVAQLDLDPRYPAGQVRAAFTDLLAVQPALRLGLHELPQPHATLAAPARAGDLPYLSIEEPTADLAQAHCQWLVTELGRTDFDLSQPPLIRVAHVSASDGSTSALVVCVHHAVFDGFSLDSLARDLGGLLTGALDVTTLRRRREGALRRELDAQVKATTSAEAEQAALGWAKRLAAVPQAVLYPRPGRPADTGFTGSRAAIPLGGELSAAVDQSCRTLGVSSFTWFSAVFAAVIARHARVTTVPVGTPVMARRTVGSFELCGLFVNTLPLIVDVDWDASFAGFASGTVARETEAVRRAAAVSWPAIIRHANLDRSSSRNPGFSCMIAMQDSTAAPPGGAVLAIREHGNQTAKVDLWLGVTPAPGGWLLELECDDELIPAAVAAAIRRSLQEAISLAAASPHARLRDLFRDAPASPAASGDDIVPVARPATLTDWLEEACRAHHHRVAVEAGPLRMTYAELSACADAVASALRERGAGPRSVVGLATATLAETVVAMLAVLRAGGAYLPLDLTLPAERVRYMTGKSGCTLCIGAGQVPGAVTVSLADLAAQAPGAATAGQEPGGPAARQPGDPAYVMFTSGSTGQPKGVLMGGEPLVSLTAWQVPAMALDTSARFLQYAPLGFDVSFQEIVPTLVAGGTVVSREPADRRDLPAVVRRVQEAAVTHVYLPVAALRAFTEAADAQGCDLGALRMVCVSGEQLMVDARVREFFARRPALTLMNLYGPTETHAVTTHTLRGGGRWPAHVPIGRPIAGVAAHVTDATGHRAPAGTPGTLTLGGGCLAHGYINDPAQTSARFVTGPDGARRYQTGDLVLTDPAGTLVFLGREDDQVKIRGYRVELGEIESAALAALGPLGVTHAVAAIGGAAADRHVLLFVTARGTLDPAACQAELATRLPSYMAPQAVLEVTEIPKTANGKVDRTALCATAGQLLATRRRWSASMPAADDPLVAELEQLWRGLLGVQRIDPAESLLDIGAHSLNVLTAIARIEADHGVRLQMLEFFRAPTLNGLAGQVRAATGGAR
jgi:amino acid adenylation domain-containing protein